MKQWKNYFLKAYLFCTQPENIFVQYNLFPTALPYISLFLGLIFGFILNQWVLKHSPFSPGHRWGWSEALHVTQAPSEPAEWIIGKIAVIANKRHFGISGFDSGPGSESLHTPHRAERITPAPFEIINKQKISCEYANLAKLSKHPEIAHFYNADTQDTWFYWWSDVLPSLGLGDWLEG